MTFWRLSIRLATACCLLTFVAVAVGRLASAPEAESVLARNPCTLPCFYGVTLGTTRTAVLTALTDYQNYHTSKTLLSFALINEGGHRAFASVDIDKDGMVESMRAINGGSYADIGQLSDILLAGQKPTRLFRTCSQMYPLRFLMTFGANDEIIAELVSLDGLAPDTQVTVVTIATPDTHALYEIRTSFGCSVETAWHGFAPLWRYFADPVAVMR